MSWDRNKRLRRAGAFLIAASIVGGTASAAILVVRSAGPSAKNYPPGRSLPENGRIALKANDMVVVLDGRGTRTFRGPGSFSPGAPVQATSRSDMVGLSRTNQRRARIGAVRGIGDTAARSPSIWHVDVTRSGTVCLEDRRNVQLWRADAARPARITIAGARGGSQAIELPAGVATATWPAQLPIVDGAGYRLSWQGAPAATTLTFKTLPARPAGIEDMAASLIRNNCQAQLDLLIETVRVPGDQAASG